MREKHLASVVLKTESLGYIDDLRAGIHLQREGLSGDERMVADALTEVIGAMEGAVPEDQIIENLVHLEKGVFDEALLDIVYSIDEEGMTPEKRKIIHDKYLGTDYLMAVFAIDGINEMDSYRILNNMKGKMSDGSPELASGLRGHMLVNVISKNGEDVDGFDWRKTGNFIHIPDTSAESCRLLDYVTGPERQGERQVLYVEGA